MSLLKPVPPPGVHPRLIFNPEDVPLIRQRLQTASGKAVMDDIRTHIMDVMTGPKAKEGAEYARLISGDLTTDFYGDNTRDLGYTMMYEAFRCLIDNDREGGQKVAAAITTMAQVEQKQVEDNVAKEKAKFEKAKVDHDAAVEKWNAADDASKAKMRDPGPEPEDGSNDFRNMGLGPTMQGTLGLDYDFAYNFMTDEQRNIVRKAISVSSANMTNIGCETLRALHSGTSNWISWSDRLILSRLQSKANRVTMQALTPVRGRPNQLHHLHVPDRRSVRGVGQELHVSGTHDHYGQARELSSGLFSRPRGVQ